MGEKAKALNKSVVWTELKLFQTNLQWVEVVIARWKSEVTVKLDCLTKDGILRWLYCHKRGVGTWIEDFFIKDSNLETV